MKISIVNIGNKEWIDFKSDITFALYYALKDLSHDVLINVNQFESAGLNLLIGADFIANDTSAVEGIIKAGIDYAILELESYDGRKINKREDFNVENYSLLIENSKFIITPYLANVAVYERDFSHKIRYLRWGFHECMVRQWTMQNDSFRYDGLFFGLLKGVRAEKVKKLTSLPELNIKIISRQDPVLFKDYFVSCARWGLNLSYGDTENFINPFRLYYMMANGMPVLADGGRDDDNYLSMCELVEFSQVGEFLKQNRPPRSELIERCREYKLLDNLKLIL